MYESLFAHLLVLRCYNFYQNLPLPVILNTVDIMDIFQNCVPHFTYM